jgi:hypothetical protein
LPGDSLRWNFGDDSVLTSANKQLQHTYTRGGTFRPSVQLIAASDCTMSIPVKDTIKVDVLRADFSLHAIFDCGKDTYQFIDSSSSMFGI